MRRTLFNPLWCEEPYVVIFHVSASCLTTLDVSPETLTTNDNIALMVISFNLICSQTPKNQQGKNCLSSTYIIFHTFIHQVEQK